MASIWQITLSGYDAQAASESGQSATGKIALGTWGSYGHETIQVTLAEPWDVCTLVTATFWPTYPPDHWDTPGIRVALGTDGLLTVPPEATNRPTQTGRVVFEGLADNEKIISADVRYTVRDHAPTGGTESTATPSLLEQLLTQTGSNAQVAAQSADAAAKSASAAAASASAAADSEKSAKSSADAASASKAEAANSASAAATSKTAAATSESNAKTSADAAAKSASAAASSANSAAGSATTAADSKTAAATSEANAKASADEAAASMKAAAASALEAAGYAGLVNIGWAVDKSDGHLSMIYTTDTD